MLNKFFFHSMNSFKLNAIVVNSFKATLGVNQHSLHGAQGITLTRLMSMWPTGFQDPITHKRDFPEMRDSGEFEKKALAPIKSAPLTSYKLSMLLKHASNFTTQVMF